MKLYRFWPPCKNIFGYPRKIHDWSLPGKSPSDAHATYCCWTLLWIQFIHILANKAAILSLLKKFKTVSRKLSLTLSKVEEFAYNDFG